MWQQIYFAISVQSPFDDNFYEIDLSDDVIMPQPEAEENKGKKDDNNLVSR